MNKQYLRFLFGVAIALVLVVTIGLGNVSFSSPTPNLGIRSSTPDQVELPQTASALTSSPDAIAQAELPTMLGMLSVHPESFGIKDVTKLQRAVLGRPIPEYTLNWDVLQSSKGNIDHITDALVDSHTWLYPLLVDDIPYAEMEVGLLNGKWQAVGVKGIGLSPAVVALQNHYPAVPTPLQLVIILERATVLIVIDEPESERIVVVGSQHSPLASFEKMYHSSPELLDPSMRIVSYSPSEIIPALIRETEP